MKIYILIIKEAEYNILLPLLLDVIYSLIDHRLHR